MSRHFNFSAKFEIKLINPEIHISTKEAYTGVAPQNPELSVEEIIKIPIKEWKGKLKNDFEIYIPYWRDSLAKCILKLNKN